MNKFSNRTKLMAGALALILAGASHAATQVGGGATLPSIGYVGANAATLLQVDGSNIDSHSLFGAYVTASGNGVSYCLTGSGAGKDILASPITLTVSGLSTAFDVQNSCVKNTVGTVPGFGANASGVGRADLTRPNFAAADSPLAASDISNYQATNGSTAFPTQFPAVAGAVAIAFNKFDDQNSEVMSAQLNLTDAEVCNIFAGKTTTWSALVTAGALTLPSGHTISGPINVQFRSDGSGTTFSLANHLANVCGTVPGIGGVFETSQAFFSATATTSAPSVVMNFFPTAVPNGNGTTTAQWGTSTGLGSSGNPGVANSIAGIAGSIGYVETANALQTNPNLQFADVNSKSPVTDFGTTLNVTASAVTFGQVIAGTNNTNGTAALATISGLPTGDKCIALVPPADYAVPGSRGGIVPSTSYPIVAVSYLMANRTGNSGDLTATQGLLTAPYSSTIQANVTTIGASTGLAFLNPTGFTSSQVSGCLTN